MKCFFWGLEGKYLSLYFYCFFYQMIRKPKYELSRCWKQSFLSLFHARADAMSLSSCIAPCLP